MFYNSNYAKCQADRRTLIKLAAYKEGKWNLHPGGLFLGS